ncbi:hypothetical protein [Vibrio bivalvicida]|uniref:ATPase n=1 Tax=Vibrio bivalvicida TaxID=1276888 RepID=A0ABV4MHA1_9VIBR
MKWHSINITIAAALLITLPSGVNSAHCDAKSWNRALKLQYELEQLYNFHSNRFNQFLQIHQIQPFLYQEFTAKELSSLWQSGNQAFHQQMRSQAEASAAVIERIEEEQSLLIPLSNQARALEQRWITISQHCQDTGNQPNVINSWQYSQLNQALNVDIEDLISKLNVLKSRYGREIEALENAKPHDTRPEN